MLEQTKETRGKKGKEKTNLKKTDQNRDQQDEARVPLDRLQVPQATDKTPGPPVTAGVSAVPAPRKAVVEKQKSAENNGYQKFLS